jgi:hypothetical protein
VTGNVTTRDGTVRVGPGAEIRGDVSGEFVEVHHEADVEGAIRASEEMSMVSGPVLDDSEVGEAEPHAAADPADATDDEGERSDGTGTTTGDGVAER